MLYQLSYTPKQTTVLLYIIKFDLSRVFDKKIVNKFFKGLKNRIKSDKIRIVWVNLRKGIILYA